MAKELRFASPLLFGLTLPSPKGEGEEAKFERIAAKVLSPDSYRGGEVPIAIGIDEAKALTSIKVWKTQVILG